MSAASGLTTTPADVVTGRVLPVHAELAGLLPWGGLRRGSTVSVRGSTSLLLALLAVATAEGSWAAVVGLPSLGVLAAAELGVAVHRLALVPRPGAELVGVVGALLDGVDLVVVAVPEHSQQPHGQRSHSRSSRPQVITADVARRLSARARQRRSVLIPLGPWPGADLEVSCSAGQWRGLGHGHGLLRERDVVVSTRGRGAAARPVRLDLRLPTEGGSVRLTQEPVPQSLIPDTLGIPDALSTADALDTAGSRGNTTGSPGAFNTAGTPKRGDLHLA
nr:hypothetical protein [Solihabitans fulvus]